MYDFADLQLRELCSIRKGGPLGQFASNPVEILQMIINNKFQKQPGSNDLPWPVKTVLLNECCLRLLGHMALQFKAVKW